MKPAMKPAERRRARQCAVQAIYSWQISKNDVADVELQFLTDQDMKGTDIAYFRDLLVGVALHHEELDRVMAPHLSRAIDELDPIERAILRLSVYEMTKRQDVPYKVVINESIELAKMFGAEDSHKFVNGVLNKLAPQVRK